MRVAGAWLEEEGTQRVLGLLAGAGHRALVVGGCVRNALLGEPVADIDVATDAPPERVTALAEAAGLKAVPTGFAHGTVTLVVAGRPYEVTTFRRDVETDGRRAVVAFTDDVAGDAARRDLTMNALYAEAGEVDEVFAVPLAHVADPVNYLVEGRIWRGSLRRYYVVPWGPYYIWGATARILRGLADRMAR
jgi:tRNA nucleotidyltransferase/poly(A) polymerase